MTNNWIKMKFFYLFLLKIKIIIKYYKNGKNKFIILFGKLII
jgi:hypothetical protein